MRLRGNGAAYALLLSDGPVLLEGSGALDRGFVDARAREHLVVTLLRAKVTLRGPRLVGGQVGVRLDDVVLDQRVSCPAVDSEVSRPRGVVGPAIFYFP